jgi:glycosyltransferase involved in cell wall biosynthesis
MFLSPDCSEIIPAMRILKVHEYYTVPGGEDSVFHNETALLRSRGHEVIEYLEFNEKIESMNKASVALQTVWSNSSYLKLKLFLQERRPQIVHFHNTFPLISPVAYYACQELNIPVVQTLDNQRLICPAASFYRDGKLCVDCLGKTPPWPGVLYACYHQSRVHTAIVASMLTFHRLIRTWQRKVDIFLCSTKFYRDLFVEAGLPASKIVVMPHFVWDEPQSHFMEGTGDYALFVGRLDPEKGVRTLLEAWRHLEFPLKIRGTGLLDNDARDFVKKHAMNQIEFVGRLEEHELSKLIRNARFLVVPSEGYYETFGMVIVEAYSRAVPVVASHIGVTPELVSNRKTGLLFEAGNAKDLARKAKWMWEHAAEAKAMGRNGLKLYEERFTPEQCYRTLISVYEALVDSK